MKIIKVAVGRMPKVMEIDHTLEAMQAVVKGLIQIYYFDDEGDIVIICNDEGKINGSLPNRAIIGQSGKIQDIIYGDFFLCRAPSDSDDLESIPDELIPVFIKRFSR